MELEEYTDEVIKKKFASGILMLGIRRVLFLLILYFTNIILYRLLSPKDFGIFGIINFLVLSLGMLTNFGLSQALVQKKKQVTKKELQAVFTAFLMSGLVFIVVLYLLAPFFTTVVYNNSLGRSGVFLIRLYALYLFFNNLSAISISLLDRKLQYKKLVIGEIATLLVTQIMIMLFAIGGYGITSFVIGNIIGRIANMVLFYTLSPWPIGIYFSFSALKRFLPFGLNFQANGIIDRVNSAVIPGFVGVVSGPAAVGYINFAGGLKQVGLAPTEVIERFVLPICARAQDNTALLKTIIEKMIKLSCIFSFPLIAMLFVLGKPIIAIVYTSKWLPSLFALHLYLVQGFFLVFESILIQVMYALGEAKRVRNIFIFWAILQWIFTVPFVIFWSYNGVVLASLLVHTTFFLPLWYVRKKVSFRFWPNVLPYLFFAIFSGTIIFSLIKFFVPRSVWDLIIIGTCGGVFYGVVLYLFKKNELYKDMIRFKDLLLLK